MPHDERTSSPGDEHAAGPVVSALAGDPDYGELIREFVASVPRLRRELEDRLRCGNLAGLCVQAHQLKGAAGGYGFPELSAIAGEVEAACESAPGGLAGERIAAELDRLLAYLGRITA